MNNPTPTALFDGTRRVDAELVPMTPGRRDRNGNTNMWALNDAEAARYGRRYIVRVAVARFGLHEVTA